MSSALVKKITVLILAVIGVLDGIYGWQFLGQLTSEVITVLVTLALAALGLIEISNSPA